MHPVDIEDSGPAVWNEEGVKISGTPVGSDRFIEVVTEERPGEEGRLWEALPCRISNVRGKYCSSAQGPAHYAAGHDMGMHRAMGTVFGHTAHATW